MKHPPTMAAAAMRTSRLTTDEPPSKYRSSFSLVSGGPFYQLLRRVHMCGSELEWSGRRVVILSLLAWLPLLVLSIAEGHARGAAITLPFLNDVEMHVRLLIALPLLLVAELVAHRRLPGTAQQFVSRGLIPDATRPQFDAAIASAVRLRDSAMAEWLLIGLVYGMGVLFIWRTQIALDAASWYGAPIDGKLRPSLAGWWLGSVSLPLFQFLLLRWYFRLFIWARFLWDVSRLELSFIPAHPDRCGGLGFLASVGNTFTPLLLAQGAMLAGLIASRIFFAGATLPQFKVDLIGLVAVMVLAILGPLLVFSPKLEAVRRTGVREYALLAGRYVREFDHKWLRGGAPADESLIGSPDIQSLADMSIGFDMVKDMRWVPFTLQTVLQMSVTTLLPVLPLMLTMISLQELLERLIKIVF
jgi:hypothetical protein